MSVRLWRNYSSARSCAASPCGDRSQLRRGCALANDGVRTPMPRQLNAQGHCAPRWPGDRVLRCTRDGRQPRQPFQTHCRRKSAALGRAAGRVERVQGVPSRWSRSAWTDIDLHRSPRGWQDRHAQPSGRTAQGWLVIHETATRGVANRISGAIRALLAETDPAPARRITGVTLPMGLVGVTTDVATPAAPRERAELRALLDRLKDHQMELMARLMRFTEAWVTTCATSPPSLNT